MDKETIEARLDVLQAEAALKTNAREAAAHMIGGIGKLLADCEDVDVSQGYRPDTLQRRLAEALDARAGMLAEAIVHDTVADDVNDGPDSAPTREPMPVSTTAAPMSQDALGVETRDGDDIGGLF